MYYFDIYLKGYFNENVHSLGSFSSFFGYVSQTFSGPEIGAQVERPPVQ